MNAPPKITLMTSREFNQDTARAKRAATTGPVFITSRGMPTHVLISKAEFDRLEATKTRGLKSLAEALHDPRPEADFDFDIPEFKNSFSLKIPDFSKD